MCRASLVPAEGPEYLVVGHLNKPHGTRGEVFAWPLTDDPEGTFTPGARLVLGDDEGLPARGPGAELEVESVRPYRKGFLVKFVSVDDRNGAEELRGRYVLRPFAQVAEPDGDEFFYHELLGLSVVTADGQSVGIVSEVYELRPHHMLEVERPSHPNALLVPLAKYMVQAVDVQARRIVITPPPGFLDL